MSACAARRTAIVAIIFSNFAQPVLDVTRSGFLGSICFALAASARLRLRSVLMRVLQIVDPWK